MDTSTSTSQTHGAGGANVLAAMTEMQNDYRSAFRGYLIDHHSPAPPVVTLDRLDPEEYRAFFRTANVSTLMVYCKDHWGYSYYDTEIGTRHPGLKSDWVGQIAAVLREESIEFNAYYCLEYDTLAPQEHPEWAIVDSSGTPVRLAGRVAKWGMPCYETDYRNYVLEQLREIVTEHRPDSLFLDIFRKSLCYCDTCRTKFRTRCGCELPFPESENTNEYVTLDFGDKGRDVNSFLEESASSMLDDILAQVKSIDPELVVTINFASLYPKLIRDKLDYQFTEPWAGNWLSGAYARDTARGQSPQLGPGGVSEVYNYQPSTVYGLAASQIAAAGCRVFFYSGSQHPDGTLEHEEARRIGEAYRAIEVFEPYLANRKLFADIAIVQSDTSMRAVAGNGVVANAIGRCKKSDPHREAVLGAMKACDTANLCWTVLPEQDASPNELSKYQLVILAGLYHLGDELAAALRAYAGTGGAIVADGACGLYNPDGTLRPDFVLATEFGCNFLNLLNRFATADWGGYVLPDRQSGTGQNVVDPVRFWEKTPDTFIPAGRAQYAVQPNSGQTLGWLCPPAVALSDTTWVNWWDPPPVPSTDWPAADGGGTARRPALIASQVGAGRCVYFAYDFFRGRASGVTLSQGVFTSAVQTLLPSPVVFLESDYPETVGFTVYEQADRLVVHVISHLAEKTGGDAPPVDPGTLYIDATRFRVRAVEVITALSEYAVCGDSSCSPVVELTESRYEIHLPAVAIHYILLVQADSLDVEESRDE